MRELRSRVDVHAFAHVTGGGIPDNLARVLPAHCDAVVRRGSWEVPRIFGEIQAAGNVTDDEMAHVFNLGIGMLAVVPFAERFATLDVLRAAGHESEIVGEIVDGHGKVHLGS
jgi:phosphoribosylformylglycinamidine cyclo-ligase